MNRGRKGLLQGYPLLWLGIIAGVGYWILEAIVDAVFFAERPFVEGLVSPAIHEMWMRFIGAGLFVVFGVVAQTVLNRKALVEENRQRLNRVLRGIRNVDQVLVRAEDRDSMLQQVCHTLTEARGYYNAWIAIRDTDGTFSHTAEAGRGERFSLLQEKLQSGWLPACGEKALASDGAVVVEEPPGNCLDCPLAEQYGGRAAIVCRLRHGDEAYGFLCASVPKDAADDEQERALFKEIADDLAFVLYKMAVEEQEAAMAQMLHEERQRYRMLVANIPDSDLYLYDHDLRFLLVDGTEKLKLGIPRDHWEGKTLHEALDEEIADMFEPHYRRALQGEPSSTDLVYGGQHYIVKTVPVTNEQGDVVAGMALSHNITERKKAQQEVEERAEKYRAIVENSHDAILIYRSTEFLFVNDRAAEITGYTKEELYDMKSPFELLHPDDRERVKDIERRRAQGEDVPDTYQARVVDKSGDVRICDFAVTPITYQGKHAALGSVRDITQQKMAEEQLRQSEEEKTLILDTSPAVIVYQDTGHRVILANKVAAESVNERPADLEGRRCHEIWHQREEPCKDCPVGKAIETGEMQEGEMSTPDGRHWLVRGTPVEDKDDEGKIVAAVETALDITKRKQAEQEMERALENERVFKLQAAHHFFNPIAISKGYMDIAMEKLPDGEAETIQKARDAVMRIQKVVENIVERGEIHE